MTTGLQLRSLIKKSGELELSLAEVAVPEPGPDEVLVRVEARRSTRRTSACCSARPTCRTAKASGTARHRGHRPRCREQLLRAMAARLDQSMPVGNEGAGIVVEAGSREAAQALMGKTVAILGGAMYAQYRIAQGGRLPAAARRHDRGRGRVVLRQSADRARHGRDHAARGSHRAGPHRGGLEPRPDAEQDLPRGRRRPGQHRAQRRAGEDPAGHRREARRRLHRRRASWTT